MNRQNTLASLYHKSGYDRTYWFGPIRSSFVVFSNESYLSLQNHFNEHTLIWTKDNFSIIVCSDGTYGLECQYNCGYCINQEVCNKTNGTCHNGCQEGFSGATCHTGNKLHASTKKFSPDVAKFIFNPFLTNGFVHPYHLDESISSFRGFWWLFSFYGILHRNLCKQTVLTQFSRHI